MLLPIVIFCLSAIFTSIIIFGWIILKEPLLLITNLIYNYVIRFIKNVFRRLRKPE